MVSSLGSHPLTLLHSDDRARAGGNGNTYEENGREYGRKYEYLFPCDQVLTPSLRAVEYAALLTDTSARDGQDRPSP